MRKDFFSFSYLHTPPSLSTGCLCQSNPFKDSFCKVSSILHKCYTEAELQKLLKPGNHCPRKFVSESLLTQGDDCFTLFVKTRKFINPSILLMIIPGKMDGLTKGFLKIFKNSSIQ